MRRGRESTSTMTQEGDTYHVRNTYGEKGEKENQFSFQLGQPFTQTDSEGVTTEVFLCLCLSVCPSVSVCLCLSVSVSLSWASPSLRLIPKALLQRCFSVSVCLSVRLCLSVSACLSLSLSAGPALHSD